MGNRCPGKFTKGHSYEHVSIKFVSGKQKIVYRELVLGHVQHRSAMSFPMQAQKLPLGKE